MASKKNLEGGLNEEEALTSLRSEVERLKSQLFDATHKQGAHETHSSALEWEVTSLRKKVKTAEETVSNIRATALAEAEGKMLLSTSKERRDWGEEKESLKRSLIKLESDRQALRDTVAQLQTENAASNAERDEVEARLRGELANLQDLSLNNSREALNSSREEVNSLGERLRVCSKEKDLLEKNLRGLKVEISREREEAAGARREVQRVSSAAASAAASHSQEVRRLTDEFERSLATAVAATTAACKERDSQIAAIEAERMERTEADAKEVSLWMERQGKWETQVRALQEEHAATSARALAAEVALDAKQIALEEANKKVKHAEIQAAQWAGEKMWGSFLIFGALAAGLAVGYFAGGGKLSAPSPRK